MSSKERLILLGRKKDLEEAREKIIIKLNGFSSLLREHSSTLFNDELEKLDDKSILVYAEELSIQINELRDNGEKLNIVNEQLGVVA